MKKQKNIDYGACIHNGHSFKIFKQVFWSGVLWFEAKCDVCGYETMTNHLSTPAELKKWSEFKKLLYDK